MNSRSQVERRIKQYHIDNAIRIATIAVIATGCVLFGYLLAGIK